MFAGSVDRIFLADMAFFAVPALAPGQECPDFLGYGPYNDGGVDRGQVGCWVGQDDASYLLWTEKEFGAEALVTIPNGGGQGVYALWDWWLDPDRSGFGR